MVSSSGSHGDHFQGAVEWTDEMEQRYGRLPFSEEEIEALNQGGVEPVLNWRDIQLL